MTINLLVFGIAYGAIAQATGFTVLQATLFSAAAFSASAQFTATSILNETGTAAAAIFAAITINARYLPIGISVSQVLHGRWWKRLFQSQLIIDETWIISHLGKGVYSRKLLLISGIVMYIAWVGGVAFGAFSGNIVSIDPQQLGLDAAFPALFLALLTTQLSTRRNQVTALSAGIFALVLTPFLPPGIPVIAAAVIPIASRIPAMNADRKSGKKCI